MKRIVIFLVTSSIAIGLLNACGPSEEEKQRREQARQDSLEQVRQQRLAEQRQDSIEQARQDSIAAAKKRERERNRIEFDSEGAFSVQVEAWRSKDKAQSQIQKWKDRGYENAYVVKYGKEETGNIWFRVRLGHLATKEMAQKLQDKLQRNHSEQSWISMTQDQSDTEE
ncbi:SPOR domain-containing protein [Fodinibius saliphilus]|uniref:SPOR domain-containing protein n=1 Tax=Fodinibius saliphilus TaxID=1920650 RepID=UPI0011088395|nr:SPOR domain-containing protein [Fodinibius saliphilus]